MSGNANKHKKVKKAAADSIGVVACYSSKSAIKHGYDFDHVIYSVNRVDDEARGIINDVYHSGGTRVIAAELVRGGLYYGDGSAWTAGSHDVLSQAPYDGGSWSAVVVFNSDERDTLGLQFVARETFARLRILYRHGWRAVQSIHADAGQFRTCGGRLLVDAEMKIFPHGMWASVPTGVRVATNDCTCDTIVFDESQPTMEGDGAWILMEDAEGKQWILHPDWEEPTENAAVAPDAFVTLHPRLGAAVSPLLPRATAEEWQEKHAQEIKATEAKQAKQAKELASMVEFAVSIQSETAKAWRVLFMCDESCHWLPKSVCRMRADAEAVYIPRWLIENKGLPLAPEDLEVSCQ